MHIDERRCNCTSSAFIWVYLWLIHIQLHSSRQETGFCYVAARLEFDFDFQWPAVALGALDRGLDLHLALVDAIIPDDFILTYLPLGIVKFDAFGLGFGGDLNDHL